MPTYRYQAQDSGGRPQSGEVAADSREQAIAHLAIAGLRSVRLSEAPDEAVFDAAIVDADDQTPLSVAETVDLGALLATLAESRLPLDAGLKAASLELGRGPLARALSAISNQLHRGLPLDEALASQGPRFPSHLRGLVLAGLHSGRLGAVLEEFVSLERRAALVRRQVGLALAYPLLLISLLLAVFAFFGVAVVPGIAQIFDDFDMDLPTSSVILISMSDSGTYVLAGCLLSSAAVWLFVWLSTDVPELRSMLKSVPLLGSIARWAALARFCRLLALLIENRLTMPECLRLAGVGARDAELLGACRRAADNTAGGQSLRASLGAVAAFTKSQGPNAEWGEQATALPEALRTAAEMFEGRVETQLTLLRMLAPPLTFLLVLWGLLFLVSGALLPMVSLIEKLT